MYSNIIEEWGRPDFISAIEQAIASEDAEDGLKWFRKSIEYASAQVYMDSLLILLGFVFLFASLDLF